MVQEKSNKQDDELQATSSESTRTKESVVDEEEPEVYDDEVNVEHDEELKPQEKEEGKFKKLMKSLFD